MRALISACSGSCATAGSLLVAGAGVAKDNSDCKLRISPGLCLRAAGAESEEAAGLVAAVGELSAPVASSVVQCALDDECGRMPFLIHS